MEVADLLQPCVNDEPLQQVVSSSKLDGFSTQLTLPANTDPQTLTTPSAVKRALQQLKEYSSSLDETLERRIEVAVARIGISQDSIAALAPQIDLLAEEAQVLHGRLIDAARTSDRISGAVKVLDEERRRIRLASSWVQSVQDLRASLDSLASAVDQGEWELATKHAQKAMAVPQEIIESEFAKRVVPSTEQPLPPRQALDLLRGQLLVVFTHKFKQATEALDQVEASKYFRLFPLVGFRTQGLEAYSSFARDMIRGKGKAILEATTSAASAAHPKLLTALFEQLAILIDTHQPVVDHHYGRGNFAVGVMPGLQEECDYVGTRILDSWLEKAAVMRRLDEARAFNFHFLANLGPPSSIQVAKTQSGRSAAATTMFGLPGRPLTPSGITRPGTPRSVDEQQAPDGRDVDRLLGELATIASKWATYKQFLHGRLTSASTPTDELSDDGPNNPASGNGELKDFRRASVENAVVESGPVAVETSLNSESSPAEGILRPSSLAHRIDGLLEDVYCPLERWYLRSSLEKVSRHAIS